MFSCVEPLTEDYCGVEPVTHPPDIIETRPPPFVDEDKLRQIYQRTDSAILGGKIVSTCYRMLFVQKNFEILCSDSSIYGGKILSVCCKRFSVQTFQNFMLCFNLVKHSDCSDTRQIFFGILSITYVVIGKPHLLNKP